MERAPLTELVTRNHSTEFIADAVFVTDNELPVMFGLLDYQSAADVADVALRIIRAKSKGRRNHFYAVTVAERAVYLEHVQYASPDCIAMVCNSRSTVDELADCIRMLAAPTYARFFLGNAA